MIYSPIGAFTFSKTQEKLSKDEEKQCKSLVKKFLRGDCSELNVGCDMRKIHLCFNFLKHSVTVQQQKQTVNKENQTSIYEELLRQKDEEIRKNLSRFIDHPHLINDTLLRILERYFGRQDNAIQQSLQRLQFKSARIGHLPEFH